MNRTTRKTKQERAVVYSGTDTRTEKTIWYTDVFAVEKPLRYFEGKREKLGRVREIWHTQSDALNRQQEINEFFFPTDGEHPKTPRVPTILSREQAAACEEVFLVKVKDTTWGNDPRLVHEMFAFCRKNNFVPSYSVKSPYWGDAWAQYILARTKGERDMRAVRTKTASNHKNWRHLTTPSFASFRMSEITAQTLENWIDSEEPIYVRREDDGKFVPYTGRRPFTWRIQVSATHGIQAFVNWCARKGWCSRIRLGVPVCPSDEEELERPAFSLEEKRALMEWAFFFGYKGNAPDPGSAQYAAFYSQTLYGGARVAETHRTDPELIRASEGTLAIKRAKYNPRENEVVPIFAVLASYLKGRGLYKSKNLKAPTAAREVIQYLAGWEYSGKAVRRRGKRFLKWCADRGITTPKRGNFGPWENNAPRRTSLSMHYKLFRDEDLTVQWAGTSLEMFYEYYKRIKDSTGHLINNAQAGVFWTELPRDVANAGLKAALPRGHKLDGALGKQFAKSIRKAEAAGVAAAASIKLANLKSRRADVEARLSNAEKDLKAELATGRTWRGLKTHNAVQYWRRKLKEVNKLLGPRNRNDAKAKAKQVT